MLDKQKLRINRGKKNAHAHNTKPILAQNSKPTNAETNTKNMFVSDNNLFNFK